MPQEWTSYQKPPVTPCRPGEDQVGATRRTSDELEVPQTLHARADE